MVCNIDDPTRLAFPLRRGLVWRRRASELRTEAGQELLPGIASLFNGALFRASTLAAIGVPDLRLFIRGDEVEMHRRLIRSGLPFGTCLDAAYLHPADQTNSSRSFVAACTPNIPTIPGSGFHLPQPWLCIVATRPAQTIGPGMAAVRLVLPGDPPRP